MSQEAILSRLTQLARQHLQFAGTLTAETSLAGELAQDSLSRLTLLVEVENAFRTCIDDEEASRLHTVGELVALLAARAADAPDAANGLQNGPHARPHARPHGRPQ